MRRLTFAFVACCVCLPSASASDAETANDICQVLRDGSNAAGETLEIEQLPKGFVCRDAIASSCPTVGSLSWIGRTDAGTRFWADPTGDPGGILSAVSLEQLRGIEMDFQDFLKRETIDPAEAVIRVYGADGVRFEERKIRFRSLPRDFVLDVREPAARATTYTTTDQLATSAERSSGPDPIAYAPIEVVPELRVSNPCR